MEIENIEMKIANKQEERTQYEEDIKKWGDEFVLKVKCFECENELWELFEQKADLINKEQRQWMKQEKR